MKLLKMTSLMALTALLAMAFVGASSALAEPTGLCAEDVAEATECRVDPIHEVSSGTGTLLNSISNVLCSVLFSGEVTAVGSPLTIKGKFSYTNCKDEKPNSCTVEEVSESSTIKVLKVSHEKASVTGEGEVKVVCSGISCTYNGKELEGTATGALLAGNEIGETSIQEQTTNKTKGLLCPTTAKLDLKTEPLSPVYIVNSEEVLPYLCRKVGKPLGQYKDSFCTQFEAGGEWERIIL